MLDVVFAATLTLLAVAAVLTFIRVVRGPTLPDRVIALDLIGVLIVCTLVVVARILCAIDLEKASERAFDRALSLARIGNARLFILHATPARRPHRDPRVSPRAPSCPTSMQTTLSAS